MILTSQCNNSGLNATLTSAAKASRCFISRFSYSTWTYDKFFHILFEMFCEYMSGFSITYNCPVKRRCNLMCYHCIENNVEIAKTKLVCASPRYCSNQKIFGVHSHYRRWLQMVGWRNKTNQLENCHKRWKHPTGIGILSHCFLHIEKYLRSRWDFRHSKCSMPEPCKDRWP